MTEKAQGGADKQQPASDPNPERERPDFWMRGHYSLGELRDVIPLLKDYPDGVRAAQLNRIISEGNLIRTQKGSRPAPTTLYHYRRALLRLGLVKRKGRSLVLAWEDPLVAELIARSSRGPGLSPYERRVFAELVLRNSVCREHFFDLFMPDTRTYGRAEFIARGTPVIWQESGTKKRPRVTFSSVRGGALRTIETVVEKQAVLYGLRYWARDQLLLIDELFREDVGILMFPIQEPGSVPENVIAGAVLSEISSDSEWTVLNIRDLLFKWAVGLRVPIGDIFRVLVNIYRNHPDRVALIATSRSLATLTTVSNKREDFELRCYLRDERGRYISHIRLHQQLREVIYG